LLAKAGPTFLKLVFEAIQLLQMVERVRREDQERIEHLLRSEKFPDRQDLRIPTPFPYVYPRQLRQRLPRIGVPLADGDPDAVLDVQAVLAQTYEAGSYRERLRYDRPCVPSLPAEDQAWADELIRTAQQDAG
jgi:hypothetical protein